MASTNTKVRKLNDSELFFEVAQKEFSFLISSYWLKLSSREKLKSEDVAKTLRILYRNYDNLSLCIREDDGNQWFCRMKCENIDFEAINNKSPREVFEEGLFKNFQSSEGPLWRMKFIAENTGESSSSSNASSEKGEWSSDVILTIHHSITDGSTTINICSAFLKVLNDVIDGSESEVYDCFGTFCDGIETGRLLRERKEYLEKSPHIYEQLKAEMLEFANQIAILPDIIPIPKNAIKTTRHMFKELDETKTAKLINKFKTEGITFHAGFTAVANWALMDIFIQQGCTLESLDIGAFHDLNIRRYWPKSSYFQQGCHLGPLRVIISTDKNVGDNFWQYAKTVHNTFKKYIIERRSLDEMIAYKRTSSSGNRNLSELFSDPPPLQFYFCVTNMGDLSSILQDKGEHASINWFTRSTPSHHWVVAMNHILQTYNGKFLYGFDYSTNYVTDEFAEKYTDNIFSKLIHLPN